MPGIKDIIGMKFGRLTVCEFAGKDKSGNARWLCQCDCPERKRTVVLGQSLRSGATKSCGCWSRETAARTVAARSTTHGMARRGRPLHPLYNTWSGIIQRTTNPNNEHYKDYGARGVSLYPPWRHDFPAFLKWIMENLGERPQGKTLDRYPDRNGNYEPGNLRWGNKKQQANNRRLPRSVHGGIYKTVSGKYKAQIGYDKRLGIFPTFEQARAARAAAERQWG